ncbi:MAG TPA: CBS domain-containing protein [Acidimicrobiales bacterium]|nr:CBS domain-containing protein [Acidimicrobiales bacterium]
MRQAMTKETGAMQVRSCLRKAPVTVPPQCTVEEAAQLMGSHGVGSVLVVSGDELLGILTDRDITVRAVGAGRPLSTAVDAVMSGPLVTIQGSADVLEAYRLLKDAGVRRLPVLEDGDLAGIITADDLLVALVLELGAVVSPVAHEVLDPEIPSRDR